MLKLRNVAIVCLLSGLSWNAVASGGFPLQRIWASTLMMPAGMIPILEPRCQARVVPPTEVRKIKGQVLFARLNEVDYLYVGAAKKKVDEPSISAIEALSNLNVRGSSFDLPRARILLANGRTRIISISGTARNGIDQVFDVTDRPLNAFVPSAI